MIFHFMHPLLVSQLVPFALLLLVKTAAVLPQGDLVGLVDGLSSAALTLQLRLYPTSCYS